MMRQPPTARRATRADVPALAQVLARAFFDDPVSRWASPPEGPRPRVLERFYATRLSQMLVDEDVWTTDDLAGAALWAPPERWKTSLQEDAALMRALLHPRLLHRLPLVMAGMTAFERKHPHSPPHWYLAILGTDPIAQGRGVGSGVLEPVLTRCDEDGVAAYLESSKERNLAFYARHGFRVVEEARLPRGPRIWTMWREPRG